MVQQTRREEGGCREKDQFRIGLFSASPVSRLAFASINQRRREESTHDVVLPDLHIVHDVSPNDTLRPVDGNVPSEVSRCDLLVVGLGDDLQVGGVLMGGCTGGRRGVRAWEADEMMRMGEREERTSVCETGETRDVMTGASA